MHDLVDVQELLDYNKQVRHRYLAVLAKLPWDEVVKNREASWHSLRNIFIHTMGAIDHWLAFLQAKEHGRQRSFEDYKNMSEIQEYAEQVEQRMQEYLSKLTSDSLKKRFNVRNDLGENVEVTAEDVLIHVFEEEVHHRGEMIALLWQIEIEPPLMGWKYL
jgi:uncharacterized damage-inducible protein DinB